jgi:S1-C subfamily serine protease
MPKSQIHRPLRVAMIAVLILGGLAQSRANDGIGPRFGLTVSSLTPATLQALGLPADTLGVVVSDVKARSVAEAGGVRIGDVIQEVNGNGIADLADYEYAMRNVDTMVMFLINRKGEHSYVALEGPAEPAR